MEICDREALSAYADGMLDAAEASAMEAHLAVCPRCRAALEEIRALSALLSEPEPLPEGLHEKLLAVCAKPRKKPLRFLPWAGVAVAAMLTVAVLGGRGGSDNAAMEKFAFAADQETVEDGELWDPEDANEAGGAANGVKGNANGYSNEYAAEMTMEELLEAYLYPPEETNEHDVTVYGYGQGVCSDADVWIVAEGDPETLRAMADLDADGAFVFYEVDAARLEEILAQLGAGEYLLADDRGERWTVCVTVEGF